MHLLLVDDDDTIRTVFARLLEDAGYTVETCTNGLEALEAVARRPPGLIILDVNMPGLDGRETLRRLRRQGWGIPVLMVTHLAGVESRVEGLEAGADDYLPKPCDGREMLARVRALLRRRPPAPTRVLRLGELEVDLVARTARRGQTSVSLTRTDYALLTLLAEHRGRPVTQAEILERVWGDRAGTTHALETHLWRLRRKLGEGERALRNVPGVGYALDPAAFGEPSA